MICPQDSQPCTGDHSRECYSACWAEYDRRLHTPLPPPPPPTAFERLLRASNYHTVEEIKKTVSSAVMAREEAVSILRDLIDPDECRYDHHGYCQAHHWFGEGECPHPRARRFVERWSKG